ncbi:STAS domain-containing protein [Motilibacter rhizosphaerae]|uniref:STAS domain-containing protein n=1 Tax=Motilibacter rhizosphaerae TaxID=598652 RepID=A0A4Q7NAI6_9ACTN|nr:STAS domain-containing protein [Motilibacter rhizosphaerae]RZS79458.1 STAS domain-containing protein [Motilibacter rhizosphaerae]
MEPTSGVSVVRVGTQVVVRLSGHVGDPFAADLVEVRAEVLALRPRSVALDLDGCTSLDDSGRGFLLDLRDDALREGLRLRVHEAPPDVRRLLR